MIDTNQLRDLIDFYTKNAPQPLVSGPGGDSTAAWNSKLMQRNALNFAMGAMGPQMGSEPDYFALADRYAGAGPQAPMPTGPTAMPMGRRNYLAGLVRGGSNGY